jgi:hypothetical protein
MRQTAPDSAGPSRHDFARLAVAPICLPAIDLPTDAMPNAAMPSDAAPAGPAIVRDRTALHDALRNPLRHRVAHPLEPLAARAAWLLKDCEVTLIPGADGPAMVMVERMGPDGVTASHTWLLTPLSATTLELETIQGETRLDLVAEGPPDRLLAWLWRLNLRAARMAARRDG